MGEFEISWCLHQLPDELLDMKRIEINKTDKTITLEIKEDDTARRIDMSMLEVEVVR